MTWIVLSLFFAIDIFALYLKPISHHDCGCRGCPLLLRSSHDSRGRKAAESPTHDDFWHPGCACQSNVNSAMRSSYDRCTTGAPLSYGSRATVVIPAAAVRIWRKLGRAESVQHISVPLSCIMSIYCIQLNADVMVVIAEKGRWDKICFPPRFIMGRHEPAHYMK